MLGVRVSAGGITVDMGYVGVEKVYAGCRVSAGGITVYMGYVGVEKFIQLLHVYT
jgi:hypothetical protein